MASATPNPAVAGSIPAPGARTLVDGADRIAGSVKTRSFGAEMVSTGYEVSGCVPARLGCNRGKSESTKSNSHRRLDRLVSEIKARPMASPGRNTIGQPGFAMLRAPKLSLVDAATGRSVTPTHVDAARRCFSDVGSIPTGSTINYSRVAQRVERSALNREVRGSSPLAAATHEGLAERLKTAGRNPAWASRSHGGSNPSPFTMGRVAHLEERRTCNAEEAGSTPARSTTTCQRVEKRLLGTSGNGSCPSLLVGLPPSAGEPLLGPLFTLHNRS